MNIRRICFVSTMMTLSLGLMYWPQLADANNYTKYTYKNSSDDNYHLGDSEVSADGSMVVAIGGTGVISDAEVVVFTADQEEPAWKITDFGHASDEFTIFDVDISADGSTIVACGSAVWLIDTATQAIAWTAYDDDIYVFDTCTLSDDGQTIVAGDRQSSVMMWERSSNMLQQEWIFTDGGFVDQVALTGDGTWLLAQNGYSYGAINTTEDAFRWETEVDDDIYAIGLNHDSGKIGYLIQDYDKGGSDDFSMIGLNPRTGQTLWTKHFTSGNTPRARLSDSGHRLLLTTNDVYYGLKGTTGRTEWRFKLDGSNTSAALSGNGKFLAVTEGYDYIYLLSWDYPRSLQRPFQIDTGVFPSSAGISNDSSTLVYEYDDYSYQQIVPGILVDVRDKIPVYSAGDDITLRYHVSNPGKKANLKIKTTVSLPQVSILSDLGADVSGEAKGAKNKLLDYANKTLPGYEELETRSVQMVSNDTKTMTVSVEMPDLILPEWLGDLLELLGLDELFASLMGDYADPLNDLVNTTLNNALTDGATDSVAAGQATYAMLGLGQVEIYDADTNEVYSTDTFYFMYLVL